MYVCIDIGGTKTLVASITASGIIEESHKISTPDSYEIFLLKLKDALSSLTTTEFRAGTIAVPGAINRSRGIVTQLGNRQSWRNLHILRDIERITHCPMLIENDAKLAGLSESMLLKYQYKRVLYITISTGIGFGLTVDSKIDSSIGDGGGRTIILPHNGKMVAWEDFASGSAIVKKYGKQASDITDTKIWSAIARDLTPGILELIAVLNPEVIVIGGGAGHYLDRFHDILVADLHQYEMPMLQIPPILPAQRPDEAVLYGCYDYARQFYV